MKGKKPAGKKMAVPVITIAIVPKGKGKPNGGKSPRK